MEMFWTFAILFGMAICVTLFYGLTNYYWKCWIPLGYVMLMAIAWIIGLVTPQVPW